MPPSKPGIREGGKMRVPIKSTISFLGYVISSNGVSMDKPKVSAVVNWPMPSTIRNLQCFQGFTNFYLRFIKGFNSSTHPLTSLLHRWPNHLLRNPAAEQADPPQDRVHLSPNPENGVGVEISPSYTLLLLSPESYPQLSRIMILGTENCCQ